MKPRKKFSTESRLMPALTSAPATTSIILNFLSDGDLLVLREASKTTFETTKKMNGPYENSIQFIVGTGGYFEKSSELKDAWNNYEKSIIHAPFSSYPALLYKMRDPLKTDQVVEDFSAGEDIYKNGRIYDPDLHTWKVNAAWLLGQVHSGRDFQLISELKPSFIKRYLSDNYSALAREVAAIHSIGYEVVGINSKGHVFLAPTKDKELASKVKIEEMDVESKEVISAIDKVNSDKSKAVKLPSITLFKEAPTDDFQIPRSTAFLSVADVDKEKDSDKDYGLVMLK